MDSTGGPEALRAPVEESPTFGLPSGSGAPPNVHAGAAIVAVNGVHADVGMMQVELTKAEVTLWLRSEVYHPSQLESEVLSESYPGGLDGQQQDELPQPNTYGVPNAGAQEAAMITVSGPRCACVRFEDEEPEILTRWLVCSILFGWVTVLPVLLMQPHEERPRQRLFREYLLKPCMFIMPIWCMAWVLDCAEVMLQVPLMRPFLYFTIIHMLLPAVLVWFLMKLQVADEQLVLDQRKSREAELQKETPASSLQCVAVEDPTPTFLKELIMVNPVALVWLGTVAAVPIVISSMLTRTATERARLAQGYVNVIYGPLIALQLAFIYVLRGVKFLDMPKLYLIGFGLLLSIPCFLIWCFCLMCSSRYGRQDMMLVERQRVERANAVVEARGGIASKAEQGGADKATKDMIDLTEAMNREWTLIFSA